MSQPATGTTRRVPAGASKAKPASTAEVATPSNGAEASATSTPAEPATPAAPKVPPTISSVFKGFGKPAPASTGGGRQALFPFDSMGVEDVFLIMPQDEKTARRAASGANKKYSTPSETETKANGNPLRVANRKFVVAFLDAKQIAALAEMMPADELAKYGEKPLAAFRTL